MISKEDTILLTGGSGFLGKQVQAELVAKGYKKIIVPRSKEYNLVDGQKVRELLDKTKPTVVIHLAATVGGIGANKKNPGRFFYENLMMGVQLMHESYIRKIKKFVAVGTVCAYPKFTPVPFKEEDVWNGYPEETNAPYGLAKKMLLVQAQSYRQQYGFNAIYLLPANLYGPHDNFDLETSHVIPAMIRKFAEAKESDRKEVVLWGDGNPTREFLFVEDAARAIVLAMEKYDGNKPINIGNGREVKMTDLADTIAKKVGYVGKIVWDKTKPNGQPRRCLDVSKAKKEFGFEASVSLDEGLQRTINWYLEQPKK